MSGDAEGQTSPSLTLGIKSAGEAATSQELYRTLSSTGGMNDDPLGPDTVQRVHRVIHRALVDAERTDPISVRIPRAS